MVDLPPIPKNTDTLGTRVAEVFLAFLKLGCLSFGGPIAHIAYFNHEFVARRKWLSPAEYAEIVALCQFLPGPASSQVGMTIGFGRARLAGALAAWAGFTLPSAVLMAAFAHGVRTLGALQDYAWLHGLKIAAAAVVAQAIVLMARTLSPDLPRAVFATLAAVLVLSMPTAVGQISAIAGGGLCGFLFLKPSGAAPGGLPSSASKGAGVVALCLFFALLTFLPVIAATAARPLQLFDSFYRAGALVFGGGHVVLPLLQKEVIPPGWVDTQTFLAGYGAAQAVPGPLFTFAAFLGTAIAGLSGGLICLAAIFLPSFLLIVGITPFWNAVRASPAARSALMGMNATVLGLLIAAFVTPVVPSAITGVTDAVIAAALFALLLIGRAPSWLIVALGAAAASAVELL